MRAIRYGRTDHNYKNYKILSCFRGTFTLGIMAGVEHHGDQQREAVQPSASRHLDPPSVHCAHIPGTATKRGGIADIFWSELGGITELYVYYGADSDSFSQS